MNTAKIINKYQSCELIMKELLEWLAKEGTLGRTGSNHKELKLIGVYSPVGKCLKTSFAFVLGQLLSKKHKVLYLNMECYSYMFEGCTGLTSIPEGLLPATTLGF